MSAAFSNGGSFVTTGEPAEEQLAKLQYEAGMYQSLYEEATRKTTLNR